MPQNEMIYLEKKKGLLEMVNEADKRIFLPPPLLIKEEMVNENPIYNLLFDAYNGDGEIPIEKQMAISLMNHMLTENKIVVRLSQKVLEKLTLEDENWKQKKPFTDKSYNAACSILSELNIKRIAWASRQRPAILLAFPDSPIFEYYTGDLEEDLKQMFKKNKTKIEDFKEKEYLEKFSQHIEN